MATTKPTVFVRSYIRIRDGIIQHVQRHTRRPRRWAKRPQVSSAALFV
jgi:hypothetical protein